MLCCTTAKVCYTPLLFPTADSSVLSAVPTTSAPARQRRKGHSLRVIAVPFPNIAPLLQESLHGTVTAAAHGRDAADRPKAHLLDACRAARERRFALGLPVLLSAH